MRFESTSTGDLLIMPPTGGDTGYTNANLTTDFTLWFRQEGSGLVFDSSTLFVLPNGARRSPDVSWIRRERWEALRPEGDLVDERGEWLNTQHTDRNGTNRMTVRQQKHSKIGTLHAKFTRIGR